MAALIAQDAHDAEAVALLQSSLQRDFECHDLRAFAWDSPAGVDVSGELGKDGGGARRAWVDRGVREGEGRAEVCEVADSAAHTGSGGAAGAALGVDACQMSAIFAPFEGMFLCLVTAKCI